MTRPARVLVWMLPFLVLVGLTVAALLEPLREAFLSNPVFNAIIVGVFLIGVIVNFQQVGALSMEAGWVNRQRGRRRRGRQLPPRMLASLDRLLQQHGDQQPVRLSTLSLRAVLDSVRLRLDEARDVSRYTIGLLIFLGLLGTFWGLSARGEELFFEFHFRHVYREAPFRIDTVIIGEQYINFGVHHQPPFEPDTPSTTRWVKSS